MPRKNPNKTHYNYSIKEFDKFGNIDNITFFMTHYEIMEKYNISCPTIYRHLKTDIPIKKLNNLKIERVRIPVYKRVANDVFSHNYLFYDSESCSEFEYKNDPNRYVEVEKIIENEDGTSTPIYTYN